MRKNLTNRMKKLKQGVEKRKKSGKGAQETIKKAPMQCILAGFPNTGKSTIWNTLTGKKAKTSEHPFTTYEPQLGIMTFEDAPIQIIDDAPFPAHNKSVINSADTVLVVIDSIEQIKEADKHIWKSQAEKIFIYNKTDLLNNTELRKLEATLKSKYKKIDFVLWNNKKTKLELEKLKEKIFQTFPIIRVYTKEPGKKASVEPMILKTGSRTLDAAENIKKGLYKSMTQIRVWGPSSKFGGQIVGLEHQLKDKDIVEFKVK
jgi:ribosome-interacting GTPase 1